jgi:polar amino acid transport system substrate-binding protein
MTKTFDLLSCSRRVILGAALAMTVLPFATSFASAQTVAEIKKAGVLKAGCQVAQVPWGFTDEKGKLTGYDVEFIEMLAKDLGVKAEIAAVTPANRTAALLTGQVDILAAVMGIFTDRQKVVLFPRPYGTNDTIFIGKVGQKVQNWADMNGLRIGVARGTPQDIALTKANPAGAIIQRFDDDAGAVQALLSGQTDVFGGASTQLANIAKVAGANKYEEKFVVSRAFVGAAVRPGSREWSNYVSDFVTRKIASGELGALYTKWMGGKLAELPKTGEGPEALPVEGLQK